MSDMTDEAALIAAIRAAPDDDAPRLVYADWLTERGDPRGELITLQCRAGEEPDAVDRVRTLLREHGVAWRRHLPPSVRDSTFARGFLATIDLYDVPQLKAIAPVLAALTPVPEQIRFVTRAFGAIAPDGSCWAIAECVDLPTGRDWLMTAAWRLAVYGLDGRVQGGNERQWGAGDLHPDSGAVTGLRFSRDSRRLVVEGDEIAAEEIVLR
jgi:uncharacterized protein (TIGR02996 family)